MADDDDPIKRALAEGRNVTRQAKAESNVVQASFGRTRRRRGAPETDEKGKPLSDRDLWYRDTLPTLKFDDDDWPIEPPCPVIPLGKAEGEWHYYASAARRLIAWQPKDHSRNNMASAFGKSQFLKHCYPRFNAQTGTLIGFRTETVADAMMAKAEEAGDWSPVERVRGAGAWAGPDGRLIYHCGTWVLNGTEWQKPGVIGDHFYTRTTSGPLPASEVPPGGEGGVTYDLLELLKSWKWTREIDALLLLGWIGAAIVGGALDWRPFVWITGDTSTGKSTLHLLIRTLFGGATIAASDATAAGLWQKVKHSSWPVQLDELEAKADMRKVRAIVELARQASSGGVILRGGADHQGAEFTARSCFMFSSILVPPLPSQDMSRLAVLELQPLDPKARFTVNKALWREWGDQLRARIIYGWPRLPEVLAAYRNAMIEHGGHNARGADQFGTLLACAHILLEDDEPMATETIGAAQELSVKRLADAGDLVSNAVDCKIHLVGWFDRDATRQTIGELIRQAATPEPQASIDYGDGEPGPSPGARAAQRLAQLGIKVQWENGQAKAVLIANRHPGLSHIYLGSDWQGAPGAAGVWRQALKRLPGADTNDNKSTWFAGVESKVVAVPIRHFLPAASEKEAAE